MKDLMITVTKPKPVGRVVHFYDKLGVGILELTAKLSVGDTITFQRGGEEYSQLVESLQVDHEDVQSAKKGQSVGVKVDAVVKEGSLVVKG